MRRICAWCGKELDAGEPIPGGPSDAAGVASTICRECADALAAYRKPVLVVSPEWAWMYEQLVELLKARPEIQVILDRRQPPGVGGEVPAWDGPDRRRGGQPLVVK